MGQGDHRLEVWDVQGMEELGMHIAPSRHGPFLGWGVSIGPKGKENGNYYSGFRA